MGTKNNKGGAALELALVLPVFAMLVFGMIEFGFIMYDKAVITNASREAARKGIVFHQPEGGTVWADVVTEMVRAANSYGATHLVTFGTAPAAPAVTIDGNCFTKGSALTVTVSYPYTFLVLPNFARTLTGELTLTGVTVMNCENQ